MMKCGKCSADLKQGELVAKCVECSAEFHPACTHLGSQNLTKVKCRNYKCETCILESSSSVSQRSTESSTALDKKTLLDALISLKIELKNHTDAAVGNVVTKLDTLKEDVHSLSVKFSSLELNQSALQVRCEELGQANAKLVDQVRSLHARLDDVEQHSRCANIEIVGIPETSGENVYTILQKLANALGLEFKREDVSIAHRLRLFSKKYAHPPIIAQFVSRSIKDAWLAAARRKKAIKTSELSSSLLPSDVYINDHLTGNNKGLLGRARRMQREGKIHFAGYFNGKILIKPRERDAAVRIYFQEDLDKFD